MTVSKIDSNTSALSFCEEASIGVLPGSPIWYAVEPNSFKNWGGTYTQTPRNPINAARQRRRGSITDLKVEGGYVTDLTHDSATRLMQGVIFGDIREKVSTAPMNSAAVVLTSVTTTEFVATGVMPAFLVGGLVLCENDAFVANNGLHVISAVDADSITTTGLTAEGSPLAATVLTEVGFQFAAGDAVFTNPGSVYPHISSTVADMTTFGLIPGEWVFVGGDATLTKCATAANNGFARIHSVTAHSIVFDKTSSTWVTDAGTSKTLQLFFGRIIKNETSVNLIKRRSYQWERTLGNDGIGVGAEYMKGAVNSEAILSVKAATKVTLDLTFMGIDNVPQDGAVALAAGTRVPAILTDCFNTASDFVRMNMSVVNSTNPDPVPLFAYLSDMTLTVKNNVSEAKAIGILGAFDMVAGTFDLSMSLVAFFNSTDAVTAVRNNSDFTVDCALVKNNKGIIFDAPLVAAGGGLANVVQDKPIEITLTTEGVQSSFGHTLAFNHFPYLPNAA